MSAVATPPRASTDSRRTPAQRYRHSLWLLTVRDLRVRYTTSALGYLWSILDPLLMSLIYWFVFTQVFHRGVDHPPYIVFLLTGLLPWVWFSGAVGDATKAFMRDAKLVRSTTIPRSIWVARTVLSKGIEFALSIPVLAVFVIFTEFATHSSERAHLHWQLVFFPLAMILQFALTMGISLIIAPVVVFFTDLERAVKLLLRFGFYASPVVYSLHDLGRVHHELTWIGALNPMAGIIGMYRAAFFPSEVSLFPVLSSVVGTAIICVIGALVFRRCIPTVLKEL